MRTHPKWFDDDYWRGIEVRARRIALKEAEDELAAARKRRAIADEVIAFHAWKERNGR